jgi:hypothetical protein
VGIVLGIALASDLVSLLVAFWEAASPLRFFGFLEYYGPLAIVRTGELPSGDIAILVGLAVMAWVAGLVHFSRRDIPAA